jgi:dienelactone hydrolase
VTGPETAERGILYIYDVFGFRPQSIQGADILAHASNEPCLVVMVDWFEGGAVQEEWMTSDEGRKLMYQFIETTASPTRVLPSILETLAHFKTPYPSVSKWGAVGYCWGGKLVSLIAAKGADTPLVAGAQSSPARLDVEEAKKVTIPMAMLASGKEDAAVVKEYGENLKADKHVEIFSAQTHGWMSARWVNSWRSGCK